MLLFYQGRQWTTKQIGDLIGLKANAVRVRVQRGWSVPQLLGIECSPTIIKRDITGKKFGRLLAEERTHVLSSGVKKSAYRCLCDCGNSTVVMRNSLIQGNTKSCGCLRIDGPSETRSTHKKSGTPEYKIWAAIKRRCFNEKSNCFQYYGGRGIVMCQEWSDDFVKFLDHIGPRPSLGHSVDRIDNDRGYEPGNVRWATKYQQSRNNSANCFVVVYGEKMIVTDAAERFSIKATTVWHRLSRGWNGHDAVTIPAGVKPQPAEKISSCDTEVVENVVALS